jgi:hypothetical protein
MPDQPPTTLERKKAWLKRSIARNGPDNRFAISLREQIELEELVPVQSHRFVVEAHNLPPGTKSNPKKPTSTPDQTPSSTSPKTEPPA